MSLALNLKFLTSVVSDIQSNRSFGLYAAQFEKSKPLKKKFNVFYRAVLVEYLGPKVNIP